MTHSTDTTTSNHPTESIGVLVIPALSEADRLPGFLASLVDSLAASRTRVLIQVVDDGSPEPEAQRMAESIKPGTNGSCIIAPILKLEQNTRKGGAILAGWRRHPGHAWYGFVDADGAVPANEVAKLMHQTVEADADTPTLLVATRDASPGKRVMRSWIRAVSGRCFSTLAASVAGPSLGDYQCGLKILNRAAWRRIDSDCIGFGLCTDIEIVAHASRRGVAVHAVPIEWTEQPRGRVWLPIAAPAMFLQLVRLQLSLWRQRQA